MDNPQTSETSMWDPVAAVKEKYPEMGLSDQQIYSNLSNPEKFRSAFPEYSDLKDDEIKTGILHLATVHPQYDQATIQAHDPSNWERLKAAIPALGHIAAKLSGDEPVMASMQPKDASQLIYPERVYTPKRAERSPDSNGIRRVCRRAHFA